MKPFIISTDATSDLSATYLQTHDIISLPFYATITSMTYNTPNKPLSSKALYNAMRNGEVPTLHTTSPLEIMTKMSAPLEKGFDLLHISSSSQLSNHFNHVTTCAKELMSAHPGSKIIIIDSLSISTGLGLLVHQAVELKELGQSLDKITHTLKENVQHIIHEFTMNSPDYLNSNKHPSHFHHFITHQFNFKPIMHMNKAGKLTKLYHVHTRQKALSTLVKRMAHQIQDYPQDIVFISHTDCAEDAAYVAHLIKTNYEIGEVIINEMHPYMGAYVGPGTLSIQYLGNNREDTF